MEVRVNRFHIIQSDWLPQQLFVERQREASIDVMAVEHRHAHDTTHKVEVRQVLLQDKPGILVSHITFTPNTNPLHDKMGSVVIKTLADKFSFVFYS